jgi:hypothetical protein
MEQHQTTWLAGGSQVAGDWPAGRVMPDLVAIPFGWLFARRSGLMFRFMKTRPLCNWN